MSARRVYRRQDVLRGLRRLFDERSPEERGVALVRFDAEFAGWQAMTAQHKRARLWQELRDAVDLGENAETLKSETLKSAEHYV